jgi:hypothetical protein
MYEFLKKRLRDAVASLTDGYSQNIGDNPNAYSRQTLEKLSPMFQFINKERLLGFFISLLATGFIIGLTCTTNAPALVIILGFTLFVQEINELSTGCLTLSLALIISIPKFAKDAYDYSAKLFNKVISYFRRTADASQNPQAVQSDMQQPGGTARAPQQTVPGVVHIEPAPLHPQPATNVYGRFVGVQAVVNTANALAAMDDTCFSEILRPAPPTTASQVLSEPPSGRPRN